VDENHEAAADSQQKTQVLIDAFEEKLKGINKKALKAMAVELSNGGRDVEWVNGWNTTKDLRDTWKIPAEEMKVQFNEDVMRKNLGAHFRQVLNELSRAIGGQDPAKLKSAITKATPLGVDTANAKGVLAILSEKGGGRECGRAR